ncbi:phage antirepressor N-terminal domain-containing protein [Orbus sturtevantii]|uniref:phage antirepressor N-terminal domain-containing protein n=1 Tax=Orbus sturtevantii TaxID=3074109 RepID=UPI00370D363F
MNIIKAEVNFEQSKLITVKKDGIEYVAMRSIVEGIGLNWKTQYRKLISQKHKFSCSHMTTTGNDGKKYNMLCMPIKKLNGWLFSINSEKVKEALRSKLIKYQEECFTALHDYWTHGQATRKVMPLSAAEIEAHEIARLDSVTFVAASKGSNAMTNRKMAKKLIKSRIEAWQNKYQLQFNYQLIDTSIKAIAYA